MKNVTGKAIGKLYINQFAISIFSWMILLSAGATESNALIILASLLAIGVYLFIIYDMMWNDGAKAAAKTLRAEDAQINKIKTPFLIILFGSAFNILCAVLYLILKIYIYANELTEGYIVLFGNNILYLLIKLANGMYSGFDAMLFPNPNIGVPVEDWIAVAPMLTEPYFYFLIPVPLFITGICAYYLGASELKLAKILGFKSNKN
jgi:hypothetical protein